MGPLKLRSSIGEFRIEECKNRKFFRSLQTGIHLLQPPMLLFQPGIPNPQPIRNIIFDFGGVICNIDIDRTRKMFKQMGMDTFNASYSISEQEDLFRKLERGAITSQEFRDILKSHFSGPVTDIQIDEAWNAMLLDIPEPRIRLIEKLGKQYRIFLLSNSNEIHYEKFLKSFRENFGYSDFGQLFEKAYFSFHIQLQKPGREIFNYVLNDSGLLPHETLFIDDSFQHIETAGSLGILTRHLNLEKGEQITDLFKE